MLVCNVKYIYVYIYMKNITEKIKINKTNRYIL